MNHGVRDLQVAVVARTTRQRKELQADRGRLMNTQFETRVPIRCNVKINKLIN